MPRRSSPPWSPTRPATAGSSATTTAAVTGIVEQKDADEAQRSICEINAGMYAFDAAALRDALGRIGTDNAQGEEYLTDVLGLMVAAGLQVAGHQVADPLEALGVNDRVQLAAAAAALRDRKVRGAPAGGRHGHRPRHDVDRRHRRVRAGQRDRAVQHPQGRHRRTPGCRGRPLLHAHRHDRRRGRDGDHEHLRRRGDRPRGDRRARTPTCAPAPASAAAPRPAASSR